MALKKKVKLSKTTEVVAPAPRLPMLVTVEDVAEILGVSRATAYRYIRDGHPSAGKLPARNFGKNATLVQQRDVDGFKQRLRKVN